MITSSDGRHWLTFAFRGEEFAIYVGDPERLDTIQKEIAANGTFYEIDELLLLKQHLKPGARIVDAGANIGNHAIFFDRVCRGGEVIVFEPNPDVIEELRANLEKNRCARVNTAHLGIGLGDEPGQARLALSPQNEGWLNRAGMELRPDPDGVVPIARLDDLVQGRVDLLKVDVEGMALQVLRGAARILAEHRPAVFVEIDGPGPGRILRLAGAGGVRAACHDDNVSRYHKLSMRAAAGCRRNAAPKARRRLPAAFFARRAASAPRSAARAHGGRAAGCGN